MAVPNLNTALRRIRRAEAMVKTRETAPRARIDVRHAGEPFPSWPDKRPQDRWLVIDLSQEQAE